MAVRSLGCALAVTAASGQSFEWVATFGSSADDIAQALAVDPAGNTYLTGHVGGHSTFGSQTVSTQNAEIMFLAKLDARGDPVWARQASESNQSEGRAVVVDPRGRIFVAGYFVGSTQFGDTTLTSRGYADMFLAQYDSDGNPVWARRAGGDHPSGTDVARALALDSSGNCYVYGEFRDSAQFEGITLTGAGLFTSFLAKYDPNGTLIWARVIAPTSPDDRRGLCVDPEDHVILTGNFLGRAVLGSEILTSAGSGDILVGKLDPAGNFIWARQAGGEDEQRSDSGSGVAVDGAGNIYVTGFFFGTAKFGSTVLTSAGANDVFVAAYTRAGALRWAKRAGGVDADSGNSIATDGAGGVFITGFYLGNSMFGQQLLLNGPHADLVIAKFDSAGRQLWVVPASGSAYSNGTGIVSGAPGSVFVGGYVRGANSFGGIPTPGRGVRDIFIARLVEAQPPRLAITREGGRAIISWPASFDGYKLEVTGNAGWGAAWSKVAGPVGTGAQRRTVTNDLSAAPQFFRLSKP